MMLCVFPYVKIKVEMKNGKHNRSDISVHWTTEMDEHGIELWWENECLYTIKWKKPKT